VLAKGVVLINTFIINVLEVDVLDTLQVYKVEIGQLSDVFETNL
jgi:hypothetical protein